MRVLDARRSPSAGAGPTGNGSSTVLDDPVEEQVALRRLELLRVLLGVGQRAQVGARTARGPGPRRPRGAAFSRIAARLARTCARVVDVLLGRVHRQLGGRARRRARRRPLPASRRPCSAIARANRVAVRSLELGRELDVDPLRLAGLAREAPRCASQILLDLGVRELERLEHRRPRGSRRRRPRPSSAPSLRADDDEVERRLLELLGSVGLTTNSPSMRPTRTAPTGPRNGSGEIISAADAPLMQRMSCGVTRSAERTVQMTCTSLRKPFGQSGRIGRSIIRAVSVARSVGAPFALEEAARDLPGGVHPLLDVDREREEVRVRSRASGRPDGRREHHRLAGADDDGAVGLLGELARLEDDLLTAHVDGNRGDVARLWMYSCEYPFTFRCVGRWRFESARRRRARGSLKLPPPLSVRRWSLSGGGRAP